MATQPAILGSMRVNNARLGYNPTALARLRATRIRIYLAGALASVSTAATRVRRAGLAIHDVINETPSTCNLIADTAAPSVAQALRVTINSDTPRLLFNGAMQTVQTSYDAGNPANLAYPCSAIDDLEKLKRRRPFGTFDGISATTVVQQLAASFAPGFTTVGVQAGLPPISINLDGSEGWDGALKQIAALVGGYYYIEDGDIHLFTSEATDLPDPVDASHPPLTTPAVTLDTDLTQLRTRVYGKGYGTTVPTDVLAGETIVPVASSDQFNGAGGRAIADTQRLAYTGVQLGMMGSLVGPGVGPAVAPNVDHAGGAGLGSGTYQYAYTDVTASGESLPSPLATIDAFTLTAPAAAPFVGQSDPNVGTTLWFPGQTLDFKTTYSAGVTEADLTLETAGSPVTTVVAVAASFGPPYARMPELGLVHSSDVHVRWVRGWVQIDGGGYRMAWSLTNVPGTTSFVDGGRTTFSAYTLPAANGTLQRVNLSGVAAGASPTSSRKIYRTVVNGSQLKLLTTLADNTTTTYADSTADGSLGANVPTSDTSGLTQVNGQVNAGSTSLLTASTAPFSTSGGWAVLGSQAIRYTGISGNTLTGIPASGPGSLINTVKYSEHVDASPALTGVTGLSAALAAGDPIHIWVQRDDVIAQAAMAAIDGGDGIYEYLVSDERRNETSLTALCDANLQIYSRPIVTLKYATRDVKTKAGKPVTFTSILGYTGTLTIQDVSISEIDLYPGSPPKFQASASSVRVSLEAVLKTLLGEAA